MGRTYQADLAAECFKLSKLGLSQREIAVRAGCTQSSVNKYLKRERENEGEKQLTKALGEVGYNVSGDIKEPTPQDAWDSHTKTFERKVSESLSKQWQVIKRPKGPFCIFHQTDPHVDDDGSALKLIEQDIKDAQDLDSIMCHGGDLLNNWPLGGRLAKKWAEQECTMPAALLRAQHYISIFKPDVWTMGNHEEMSSLLPSMIDGWLPKGVIKDYWNVNFVVKTAGGKPIKVIMSHKFQKGSSWFHRMHGHLREILEGQEADLYMDGHLHCDGVMEHSLPERGIGALGVASGGYKLVDEYARRISKSSGQIKIRGRCHFIICDPQADSSESSCTAFKSARQAEAYLNGLQNLRAA